MVIRFRYLKYFTAFSLPILAFVAMNSSGLMTFLPLIEAFALIPIIELLAKPQMANLSKEEEKEALNNKGFDWMIYLISFVHFGVLIYFLFVIDNTTETIDLVGKTMSMGLMCGSLGINVAHELGHRNNKMEQTLAQGLLMTSLYMHFFIEHNRGHHKNIGTKKDPATARVGESLYKFWIRAIWQSYWHAWKIENDSLRKRGIAVWSLKNQMLRFQLSQITLLLLIFFVFGWFTFVCFVAAAVFGFVLLETIDYVEHYGLTRKEISPGVFERPQPHHSWDSNFPVGRLVLFELSRHADHHYLANRKYQILRSHESAPQMPTGYPGMMILSLLPPLWFAIMNKRLALQTTNS